MSILSSHLRVWRLVVLVVPFVFLTPRAEFWRRPNPPSRPRDDFDTQGLEFYAQGLIFDAQWMDFVVPVGILMPMGWILSSQL